MDALSRPPVPSSPRPSRMKEPRSSPRLTSASARELTTAARNLASWPSGRSGWVVYSVSVTARRARNVLLLGLVAALARNQGGDRSLPLRPAVARVAARHLPLRNSHGYFSCFSSTPASASAPLISSFSPSPSEPASPCSAAQR